MGRFFTIEELCASATAKAKGIPNEPSETDRAHLEELITCLLDPLREDWSVYCVDNKLGSPALIVTSGYRGFRLNSDPAINGSKSSAHCIGYAADIVPRNGQMESFVEFVKVWKENIAFDQIIWERCIAGVPTWVHFGYKNRLGQQRCQVFSL